MPRKRKYQLTNGLLPEELEVRRLAATAALAQMRKIARLGTDGSFNTAATYGRRNHNWYAPRGSADLAYIPDAKTLIGRTRDMLRNNWAAQAVASAFADNVVGRGIKVVPFAVDRNGVKLTELNRQITAAWEAWCKADNCDVEGGQSFVDMQETFIYEWIGGGECFGVWSYTPNSAAVGLQLQVFESDQLYDLFLVFGGNEVRGGVEVDRNGKPVAYHFWQRNPNDLAYANPDVFYPVRVPRERVFHFFHKRRGRQTRGPSPLLPVLQDLHDAAGYREATLMSQKMQACMGLLITKNQVSNNIFAPGSPGYAGVGPLAPNESSTTQGGVRTADFFPGMVFEGLPGEEVKAFSPSNIAQQFKEFMESTLRGVAAGTGISYSQLVRHAEGSYSAARMDKKMDAKTWRRVGRRLITTFIEPTYIRFLRFAAAEGRLPAMPADYWRDPKRYERAKFLMEPEEFVDPQKEVNADQTAIRMGLKTRREIIESRGGDFDDAIAELSDERRKAAGAGIMLSEDVQNAAVLGKANVPVADVLQQAASHAQLAQTPTTTVHLSVLDEQNADEPQLPPHYRQASDNIVRCITCSHLQELHCTKFDYVVETDRLCDDWVSLPPAETRATIKGQPWGPQPGQPPLGRGDSFDSPQHRA
ncbi:MAG: phage portal protein [Planctomycetia bacterium]|nr:phage portal protein [Planctomycetia bacterium]